MSLSHVVLRAVGAIAVVGCLGAGCGGPSSDEMLTTERAGERADFTAEVGACPEGDESAEGVAAAPFVASVAEWFEIDLDNASESLAGGFDRSSTATYRIPGSELVAGQDSAARHAREIQIHGSLLEGIDAARQAGPGSRALIGLGGPDVDGQALFLVVMNKSGEFAFAGHCQERLLTDPMTTLLASQGLSMIELVGLTGSELEAQLGLATSGDTPGPAVLNPEFSSLQELEGLTLVSVVISPPDDWRAPATLCTRIERGWNDCMPLDGSIEFPQTVSAYVVPGGSLEFWLLDEAANLMRPIQRLGSIEVAQDLQPSTSVVASLRGRLAPDGGAVEAPVVQAELATL